MADLQIQPARFLLARGATEHWVGSQCHYPYSEQNNKELT